MAYGMVYLYLLSDKPRRTHRDRQQLNIETYGEYYGKTLSAYPPELSYRYDRRSCEKNQTEICFHIHRNRVARAPLPLNQLLQWSEPTGEDSMATSLNRRDPIDLTWVCAPYWIRFVQATSTSLKTHTHTYINIYWYTNNTTEHTDSICLYLYLFCIRSFRLTHLIYLPAHGIGKSRIKYLLQLL